MPAARQLRICIALILVSSGVLAVPACSSDSTPPVCGSGKPSEMCLKPGAAGCPARESVQDDCCNMASVGPFGDEDGKCCYWICEDACC